VSVSILKGVIVKSELLVLVHLLWSDSRAGFELPITANSNPKT